MARLHHYTWNSSQSLTSMCDNKTYSQSSNITAAYNTCITNMDTFLQASTITGADYSLIRFKIKLYQVTHGYIMFILCFLGIMGNALALVILTRKSVKMSTVAVYLRALSIADVAVLITAIFRYKTYKLFLTEEEDIHSVFSAQPYIQVYIEPLHWMSLGMSSFITLALSIERFLAIKYPLSIKKACTPTLVRVCIAAIFTFVSIVTLPVFFSYRVDSFELQDKSSVRVMALTHMGSKTLYPCMYHIYIIPLIWYIVPWILLAVINILLVSHVKESSKIRPNVPKISNPNRRLSILIIAIVVIYMVCNLPSCIMVFYKLANHSADNQECFQETTGLTFETSREFVVIESITEILNIFNSCINIVVYCLVGTKFRSEMKKVFRFKCLTPKKIHPNITTATSGRVTGIHTTTHCMTTDT